MRHVTHTHRVGLCGGVLQCVMQYALQYVLQCVFHLPIAFEGKFWRGGVDTEGIRRDVNYHVLRVQQAVHC